MGNRGEMHFISEGRKLPFAISNHWDFEYHVVRMIDEIENSVWAGTDNPDPFTSMLRFNHGVCLEWCLSSARATINLDTKTVTTFIMRIEEFADGTWDVISEKDETLTFDELKEHWSETKSEEFLVRGVRKYHYTEIETTVGKCSKCGRTYYGLGFGENDDQCRPNHH